MVNAQDLVKWDKQGLPYSTIFDDKYFCTENGYEETLHVSCHGNQLKERFAKLDPAQKGTFTIIETGFGTGLSFCCAWEIWDQIAPRSWALHFISIELFPLSNKELAQALSLWPFLNKYIHALTAKYKPSDKQMDVQFDNVRLTLVFDDVVKALKDIKQCNAVPGRVDAWFLNGFAPAKNPLMWTDAVFEAMAPLSKATTTMSTFTVAGFVRRGLEANGFMLQKIRGFGTKKHVLTGEFRGKS